MTIINGCFIDKSPLNFLLEVLEGSGDGFFKMSPRFIKYYSWVFGESPDQILSQ